MATRPDLASPSRSAPTKEALESAPFPFDAPERARELVVALLAEGTADRVPGLQAQTRALAGEVARRIEQEGVVYAQAATRTLLGALAKKCVRALGAALGRPATAAELAEAQSRLDGQVAGLRLEHDFLVLLVDPARRARFTLAYRRQEALGRRRGDPWQGLTRSQVSRVFKGQLKAQELTEFLDTAERDGHLTRTVTRSEGPNGGRPKTYITLERGVSRRARRTRAASRRKYVQ